MATNLAFRLTLRQAKNRTHKTQVLDQAKSAY